MSVMLLASWFMVSAADKLDADGFPELYLRGTFNNNNWIVDEKYKFSRTDNVYTLTVESLRGEFKVSGSEWKYNLGAESEEAREVVSSCTVQGMRNGKNFFASFYTPVTIEFEYNPESGMSDLTPITITVADAPEFEATGTLPVIYINVVDEEGNYNNEIINKDLGHKNYFDATYHISIPEGCLIGGEPIGSEEEELPLQIKGRGNYTFLAFSKKPFKLKLNKKQDLLGLTPDKSKHYVLLAHADDNYGFMRNFTGFALGKLIGLPWTPSQIPVEVVINGNYRGLYFLTESIRVQTGRVEIEELDDLEDDYKKVSGGYIVELDNYDEPNQIRLEEKGVVPGHKDKLRVTFESPEELSPLQIQFLEQQFSAINDLVGENSDDLWSYLDLDDAARYYIVEEIISHNEAFHGSTYLFRDRGENQKWHFSPLWDCGNAFSGSDNSFLYENSPYGNTWIPTFCVNEKFMNKVRETWLWFMSEKFSEIEPMLEDYALLIEEGAKLDAQRWNNTPVPNVYGAQQVRDNSNMPYKFKKVLERLNYKTAWLAGQLGDYSGEFAEPERDDTPCAELPSFLTPSVGVTECISELKNAQYFNLQGIRVSTPLDGEVLIEVIGDKARKVYYKRR